MQIYIFVLAVGRVAGRPVTSRTGTPRATKGYGNTMTLSWRKAKLGRRKGLNFRRRMRKNRNRTSI